MLKKQDVEFFDLYPALRSALNSPWDNKNVKTSDANIFGRKELIECLEVNIEKDAWIFVLPTPLSFTTSSGFEKITSKRGQHWLKVSGAIKYCVENKGLYDKLKSTVKLTKFA